MQIQPQSGRRYGPRRITGPDRQPAPVTTEAREAAYRRQTGRRARPLLLQGTPECWGTGPHTYALAHGLTPRQRRRVWHKSLGAALAAASRAAHRQRSAAREALTRAVTR